MSKREHFLARYGDESHMNNAITSTDPEISLHLAHNPIVSDAHLSILMKHEDYRISTEARNMVTGRMFANHVKHLKSNIT